MQISEEMKNCYKNNLKIETGKIYRQTLTTMLTGDTCETDLDARINYLYHQIPNFKLINVKIFEIKEEENVYSYILIIFESNVFEPECMGF